MKYLKSFNESLNTNSWLDKEFSSPEEIAKLIDSYFRDHDYSNLMQNMEELLSNVNPDGDFFDLTRYANILVSVNTLIQRKNEPWYSVKFEIFLEYFGNNIGKIEILNTLIIS